MFADAAMSLDNVVAVAAIARGDFWLTALGVLLTIPILAYGSLILKEIFHNAPEILTFGAVVLGWTAGGMAVSDPRLHVRLQHYRHVPSWLGGPPSVSSPRSRRERVGLACPGCRGPESSARYAASGAKRRWRIGRARRALPRNRRMWSCAGSGGSWPRR